MATNRGEQEPVFWDPLGVFPSGRRWLWAALALLTVFLQGPSFVHSLRPSQNEGVDFFQEWASAKNFQNGLPVYTNHTVTAELYLGHKRSPGEDFIEWNAHPPTSILLGIPFASLDYPTAVLLWNLLSLVALGVSLWLVARGLSLRLTWWAIFPAVTLSLLSGPFRQQVIQGQLNLVLLLLIIGGWLAERAGRPRLAGGLLGAATAIKLFPGFLLLHFALRRRWRVVVAGAWSFALLSTVTAAVLGPGTYKIYALVVIPQTAKFRRSWANASLVGFWDKVIGSGTWHYSRHVLPLAKMPSVALSLTLLSCGIVLTLWARAVSQVRTREIGDLAFGLSLSTMLLVSPVTWDHYFLLLVLPLAQVWRTLPRTETGRIVRLGLLVSLNLGPVPLWRTYLPDALFRVGSVRAPVLLMTVLSYQCYALLALFIACLVTFRAARMGDPGKISSHTPPNGRIEKPTVTGELYRGPPELAFTSGESVPHAGRAGFCVGDRDNAPSSIIGGRPRDVPEFGITGAARSRCCRTERVARTVA
jgi:hypothetical protein